MTLTASRLLHFSSFSSTYLGIGTIQICGFEMTDCIVMSISNRDITALKSRDQFRARYTCANRHSMVIVHLMMAQSTVYLFTSTLLQRQSLTEFPIQHLWVGPVKIVGVVLCYYLRQVIPSQIS